MTKFTFLDFNKEQNKTKETLQALIGQTNSALQRLQGNLKWWVKVPKYEKHLRKRYLDKTLELEVV